MTINELKEAMRDQSGFGYMFPKELQDDIIQAAEDNKDVSFKRFNGLIITGLYDEDIYLPIMYIGE